MEKRTLLAIALSVAVLIVYQMFFAPPPPQPVKQVQGTKTQSSPEVKKEVTPPPTMPITSAPVEEKSIRVETGLYVAEFTNKGGTLRSFKLKKFKDKEGLDISLLRAGSIVPALGVGSSGDFSYSDKIFALDGGDINLSGSQEGTLVFTYASEGLYIKRTYRFFGDSYKIELLDETSLPNYELTLGTELGISTRTDRSAHIGPVLLLDTDRIELTPKKLKEAKTFSGRLKWIAQEDKYFFAAIVPLQGQVQARSWLSGESGSISITGGSGGKYLIYIGPKEHDSLKSLGVGLEHIIDFGFFSILARPLFWFLKFLHKWLGNWGWTIVVLTIIVRIPFIPIINKGQIAMKKIQDIQPKMQELKEKYSKDPQRLQAEMMELYKKHKVNPMSGCLPMLIQIPVFFALYKVLNIAIELRGAPYMLWITDLSQKDPYYVLPIIMGATMVIQQKMTPSGGDPAQRKLMMLMPVIFTFLFINFPSGLVLYWLVNNILAIIQQFYINKKIKASA